MSETTKEELLGYLDGLMGIANGSHNDENYFYREDGLFQTIRGITESWAEVDKVYLEQLSEPGDDISIELAVEIVRLRHKLEEHGIPVED